MKSVFTKTEEEKVGWLGSKNWKSEKQREEKEKGRLERLKEMFSGVRAGGFEGSKEGEQGEQDLLSYRLVAFPFLLSWLSLFLLPKNRGNGISCLCLIGQCFSFHSFSEFPIVLLDFSMFLLTIAFTGLPSTQPPPTYTMILENWE